MTERSGQEPQWTINADVLPCLTEQLCNEESSLGCAVAIRAVQENEIQQQIPVEVTIVQEPVVESIALKGLPVEDAVAAVVEAAAPVVPAVEALPAAVVPATEQGRNQFTFASFEKKFQFSQKIEKVFDRKIKSIIENFTFSFRIE